MLEDIAYGSLSPTANSAATPLSKDNSKDGSAAAKLPESSKIIGKIIFLRKKFIGTSPVKQESVVVPVEDVDLDAKLVAESIAAQLEKRAQFRRVMKAAMQRVMRAGAIGVKTMVSGRLDGAEIARSEHYHEGSLPLQTLRANIDYACVEAHTTFGVLGVKVWIYKGEILGKVSQSSVNHKKGEN